MFSIHSTIGITICERSAVGEGITGPVFGTATDRCDIPELAVGVSTAGSLAWVHALLVVAGRLGCGTVRVMRALGSARHLGITQPVLQEW